MEPDPDKRYIAGIDIAGEDENAEDAVARALVPRRDSTVITIAELHRDANGNGVATVVDHVWWTGRDLQRQYDDLLRLWAHWAFTRVVVDASGIGAAFASFLTSRFGERVEELVFTAPVKSKLAFDMLAMINTGRASLYKEDHSPESRQFWQEVRACRYWLRANETLAWGVPTSEGHDDFVISLALCCRAASTAVLPAVSGLVRTKPPEDELSIW
jgi:pimeloyl-ACP methyl ester carboxylesterase